MTTVAPHTQAVGLEVARPGNVDHERAKREAKSTVKAFKPYEVTTPYTGGKVKALLIGINYVGSQAQLSGCCNDVKTMLNMLQKIEFPIQEAAFLVDDPSVASVVEQPTRGNMIRYMAWLTDGAQPGDVLFLHYSGHGAQTKARKDDDEEYDQCLVPSNYLTDGTILDDDLFIALVKNLPDGVRMTVVFDCCHSASMLDLPFQFVGSSDVTDDGNYTMKQMRKDNFSAGDVLLFSGCADDGTSADVTSASGAGGAATAAFTWCVENEHGADFLEVMVKTREALKAKGFTQVPQLSCSKPLDLNKPFSLFGDLTVDEKQVKAQVPPEVQEKLTSGHKHHCDESTIPPQFRHPLMSGFDENEVRKCFKHSHLRRDRMRRHWEHRFSQDGDDDKDASHPSCTSERPTAPSPSSPPMRPTRPSKESSSPPSWKRPYPPHPPAVSMSPTDGSGLAKPTKPASATSGYSVNTSVSSHALTNSTVASPASPTTLPGPTRKPTTTASTASSTLSSASGVPRLPTGRIPKPRVPTDSVMQSPLVPAVVTPTAPVKAPPPLPTTSTSTSAVPKLPPVSPMQRLATKPTAPVPAAGAKLSYPSEVTETSVKPSKTPSSSQLPVAAMPDLPKKLFALDGSMTVHKFVKSIYGQIELTLGNVNAHLVFGSGRNCPPQWMTLAELYMQCRDAEDGMLYVRYTRTAPPSSGIEATGLFKRKEPLRTRKQTCETARTQGKIPVVVEALLTS